MTGRQGSAYVFIGTDKSSRLAEVLGSIQPGTFAPTNSWTTARKRAVQAITDRPNMFTLDGMRSSHFVLTYGKFEHVRGGIEFHEWLQKRQDSLTWLERAITEVANTAPDNRATKQKKKGA